MADLNEPKKETESPRVDLPSPSPGPTAEAKLPVANLRPAPAPVRPPQPSVAPKPRPSQEAALGPRLPASPLEGLKRQPSPSPVAPATATPESANSGFPPINRPLENRGTVEARVRKETAGVAGSPVKAAVKLSDVQPAKVPLSPLIRTAPPAVANSPVKGLGALAPVQLCWALLSISALTLLVQLWNYFS
jgi:hypothetical protein